MSSFWKKLQPKPHYDFKRLIDSERLERVPSHSGLEIVCDIDKTYLETRFESVMALARLPFEEAHQKIHVKGAPELLYQLRWSRGTEQPVPLHFVSSSPPQLRAVLAEKLSLDGLDWSTDTFKNQAYNLRKGRMDLLKHHVAYKSAAILRLIYEAPPGSEFILIGDNAENDALIFVGLKLMSDHSLSLDAYKAFLEMTGVEAHIAEDVLGGQKTSPQSRIKSILIREAPGYRTRSIPPLTDLIFYFNDYAWAALWLYLNGTIASRHLLSAWRSIHNRYQVGVDMMAATLHEQLGLMNQKPDLLLERWLGLFLKPNLAPSSFKIPSAHNLDHLSEDELLARFRPWIDLRKNHS